MYRIPDYIIGTEVENEYVILDLKMGDYYQLNPIGTEIWLMILRGISSQVIVETLMDRYETSFSILEKDLRELIDDLKAHGLLEEIQDSV